MDSSPTLRRKNPFHDDGPDAPDLVALTYDAAVNRSDSLCEDQPVDVSTEDARLSGWLLDDFFNEPLIDTGSTATVQELEDAILQCKHMYWATAHDDPSKSQKLVDRLVELRRILYMCKETSGSRDRLASFENRGRITSSATSLTWPTSQRAREGVGSNQLTVPPESSPQLLRPQLANNIESCDTSCFPSDSPSPFHSSTALSKGGHDFRLLLSIRCLGRCCEQCCRAIIDPSSRILECTVCHIVCHAAKKCIATLRRRCPASFNSLIINPSQFRTAFHELDRTKSQTFNRLQPAGRRRAESESNGNHSVQQVSFASHNNSSVQNKLWRQLDVCHLNYITSDLQAQRWVCFECNAPLDPVLNASTNWETDSAYKYVPQPKQFSPALETGICNLLKQATGKLAHNDSEDASQNKSTGVIFTGPKLLSQVSSLSNQVRDLLQNSPVFSMPNMDSKSSLAWALSTNSTSAYLGPIQTWNDACVLEAVNRMNSNGQRKCLPPLVMDHERERSARVAVATSGLVAHQPRLCYYTGHYYCCRCHWNDFCVIPARLFVLGKNDPKPVCRSTVLWLTYSWPRHLFRVPDAWYRYAASARRAFSLRLRLFRIKPYVDGCEQARNTLTKCAPDEPHWLFEQPYTFTMQLVDLVLNGVLIDRLTRYLHTVHEHVATCATCASIVPNCCTVCKQGPIRAYEPTCAVCNKCWRTCHRSCLSRPLPSTVPTSFIDENPHLSLQNLNEQDMTDWTEVLYPVINTQCRLCRPPESSSG